MDKGPGTAADDAEKAAADDAEKEVIVWSVVVPQQFPSFLYLPKKPMVSPDWMENVFAPAVRAEFPETVRVKKFMVTLGLRPPPPLGVTALAQLKVTLPLKGAVIV